MQDRGNGRLLPLESNCTDHGLLYYGTDHLNNSFQSIHELEPGGGELKTKLGFKICSPHEQRAKLILSHT